MRPVPAPPEPTQPPVPPSARELRLALPRGLGVALGWLVVFLLLSAVLLRETVEPRQLLAVWEHARVTPLITGFLLLFGGVGFMALRWRALLPRPERVDRLGMLGIVASGQLLNMALPGPVGELVAAGLVQRRYGIDAAHALAASIHARFVGVTIAALVTLVVWLTAPLPIPGGARPLVLVAVVMVCLWGVGLGVIAAWPALLVAPCRAVEARFEGRTPGMVLRWVLRAFTMGRRFGEALSSMGRQIGLPHLAAAGWNLCGLASVTIGSWIVAWALGDPGSVVGYLFTHSAVTAGAIILFALPGAQVGWDAAFASLLVAAVGLPVEQALAVTVLVRVQQLVSVALGAVALPMVARPDGPREGAMPAETG
ncbi:MAG: lysylphosphatidylglycerol synthase transmembrane domain-containing protein [Pseudomonadota bacterium]